MLQECSFPNRLVVKLQNGSIIIGWHFPDKLHTSYVNEKAILIICFYNINNESFKVAGFFKIDNTLWILERLLSVTEENKWPKSIEKEGNSFSWLQSIAPAWETRRLSDKTLSLVEVERWLLRKAIRFLAQFLMNQ